MTANIYNAFLSRFDENFNEIVVVDTSDDMRIEAFSKQDARERLAKRFVEAGAKAELSNTSEEVIITLQNGNKLVYYGFDLD